MNAIILHSVDAAIQRDDPRRPRRNSFGHARLAPTIDPLSPDRGNAAETASRQHVNVRRRPHDEPLDPPRQTGDARTQFYVEHEHIPTVWVSWQFINFLI
jgi:hypothetical protein